MPPKPPTNDTPSTINPSSSNLTTLIPLAKKLIQASSTGTLAEIKTLLKQGAPTWYQEDSMGWSCLHYACERGDVAVVEVLVKAGAVWNALDLQGNTPADISLSINDHPSYLIIRNEGIRSEMLHHVLNAVSTSGGGGGGIPEANKDTSKDSAMDVDTPNPAPILNATANPAPIASSKAEESTTTTTTETTEGNGLTLRAKDTTTAGDNLAFIASPLVFEVGEDGLERCLDQDGNGVMMGWETPLMVEHVKHMCANHPRAQAGGEGGLNVLNVGYGLGIIDKLFQSTLPPSNHLIIEPHPSVLSHLKSQGFDKLPGVKILEGRWQDWICDEKIGEVLELLGGGGRGFDVVFVDTFAEGYEELKAFFEFLPDLLDGPEAVFSFWNGLGATNPTIYDVASNLAELHLEDVMMKVEWHNLPVDDSTAEQTWKGIKRRYWNLPLYKLPIARMDV